MSGHGYIKISGWAKFQHYKVAQPAWIKLYRDLLSRDEYLTLTLAERGLLHCLWMLVAEFGDGRLSADPVFLARRLNVRRVSLESLIHAGFVEVCSIRSDAPRALAVEVEVEKREEKKTPTSVGVAAPIESLAVVKAENRNEQWDGLAAVFGYSAAGDEARLWGKLCRSLKAKGATLASIEEAARRYRLSMPEVEMTPTALDKHYQRLMAGPVASKAKPGSAEHTLMLAAQAAERERLTA